MILYEMYELYVLYVLFICLSLCEYTYLLCDSQRYILVMIKDSNNRV